MKKHIFKINCTVISTGVKTYGFVRALDADEAKSLFVKEVVALQGKLDYDITQIMRVSEKEYEKAMKGE